ncbi:MAG: SDR family NAD(P)-dependent oxidoreductase [Caldithrix sp.]|nr:SDR family NAD(P)-dependent oxidoreductase [Caldithrix sp.]
MQICVTGGAGFIGSHLVDRLLNEGHRLVVIDNLLRGKKTNIQEHIQNRRMTFLENDIRDYKFISQAMEGCEVVFHLAAQSNVMGAVENIDYSFETNVVGTFNTLKAARLNNVRRFIFTSSREVYGEADYLPVDEYHPLSSKNTYGASKVAGEKYCQVFQNMGSFEMVVLRLANVYGERDFDRVIPIFLDRAFNGKNICIYGGKQVIDFISVEIIVDALLMALYNNEFLSGPTNIGSGQGTTLFSLVNRVKALTQTKSEVIIEPPRSVEVVKFVADNKRFSKVYQKMVPDDPLYYLPKMIEKLPE